MRTFLLILFVVGFVLVANDASGQTHFTASLTGAQENPPLTNSASGTGAFSLNASRTELKYDITYRGLSGTIIGGHFHSAPIGVNGSVFRNIAPSGDPASATYSGTWKSTDSQPLTSALLDSLLNGKIYVNFHTQVNQGGEIRGQLVITQGTGFTATLRGAQENPPVITTASGTGAFSLNLQRTELKYAVTYIGLSGTIIGGHFHSAPIGVNGPVMRDIAPSGDPASATYSGTWKSTDSQPLTSALLDSLLNGKIYVNFHTQVNQGGEIRGQLQIASAIVTEVATERIPLTFDLRQNYPNPFNPSTTIRFELPRSAKISLKIFNLLGQEVATLVDGFKEAGRYTVKFDAAGLNSGLYFYRLATNDGLFGTKKMVLMK